MKIFTLFLFLIFGFAIQMPHAFSQSLSKRKDAENSLQSGDFFRAATLYSYLVHEQGSDVQDWTPSQWLDRIQLAVSYREMGDLSHSQKLLEDLLQKAPPSSSMIHGIRFELLKTLYLQKTSQGLSETLSLYRKLPGSWIEEMGLENIPLQGEAQYFAGMAAFHRNRLSQAILLFESISRNSDYYIFAQKTLGQIYLKSNSTEKAINIWKTGISGVLPKSPEAKDALDFIRLNLAQIYLSKKENEKAHSVLDDIERSSRYYQSALLGRAWAVARSNRQNRYLEAIVLSDRVLKMDPYSPFSIQASLLIAACYQSLNAHGKAAESISKALKNLDRQKKVQDQLNNVFLAKKIIPEALKIYNGEKKTGRSSLLVDTFLKTEASLENLPNLDKAIFLKNNTQKHIGQLKQFLSLLNQPNFDPYLLQKWEIKDFQPIISDEILSHPKLSPKIRASHQEVERRLLQFELAKKYSYYLLGERRWQNLSQIFIENAITEKMKNAQQLMQMDQALRNYYLLGGKEETKGVVFFESRVEELEKNLFLEDRFVNQMQGFVLAISAHEDRVKQLDKKLQKTQNRLNEREKRELWGLKRDLDFWKDRLEKMNQVIEYYRATKHWRIITEEIREYVENPALADLDKEVTRIKTFLKEIQKGDEAAQVAMFDTLTKMQRSLASSYNSLNRFILNVFVEDLLQQKHQKLIDTQRAIEGMENQLANQVSVDVAQSNKMLNRYHAMLKFEYAKVLDEQSFKKAR